jgi:lysophospholipase L1-like esterase
MGGLSLVTIGLLTANTVSAAPAAPAPVSTDVPNPLAPAQPLSAPPQEATQNSIQATIPVVVSHPEVSSPEQANAADKSSRFTLPTWNEPVPPTMGKKPSRAELVTHPRNTPGRASRASSLGTRVAPSRPQSGGQLYYQRLAALRAGQLYTRLPNDSFREVWQGIAIQPSYQDWLRLLAQEADAVAKGQGNNRLAVLLGDSLSMWLPSDGLPSGHLWLNQSISGDTTGHVLRRLPLLAKTNPDTIYVMVGVNDLRRGMSDQVILTNLYHIATRLRQQHPNARVVMQSILPTRYDAIPVDRIHRLNQGLAAIADYTKTEYMDLASYFRDDRGTLRRDLTTDGLHLSPRGYETWQLALSL